MKRVDDPRAFGRVAVVMGGRSAEREVSLDSGRNVLAALKARGVDAHAIDGIPALLDAVRAGHFARVFNILHGQHGGGEDGVLQGALQSLGIPFTGSGVLGSALSMDKVRSKYVWVALGLPTPKFVPLPRGAEAARVHAAARELDFPLIVKPACEGSSVGVSRVFE
ncbi:MAG TPA: D-alanine--D-alanine ligase, partial [Rhodanobacteraceae bacterium]|nr:D-alanine--D-alanine ligase [Rhodanobacteraceae bacterium]